MTARFLADEHVPGPFVRVLRSTGHDVLRVKEEFSAGTDDGVLLEFANETDRTVVTADKRFTIVDGDRVTAHAGVVFVEQSLLQRRPEEAARGIDRIVETIPEDERLGSEFYLSDWL